jgi:protocatechuate 3,4-dioxygenase beta subunit
LTGGPGLVAHGVVSGRLVDVDGAPCVGVVELGCGSVRPDEQRVTDEVGAFRFEGVWANWCALRATVGARVARSGPVALPLLEARVPLLLRLGGAQLVEGKVLDAEGRPAPGARVELLLPEAPGEGLLPPLAALADSTGRFSLSAPVGGSEARLRAVRPGALPSAWRSVTSPSASIELRLRAGARLQGVVRDEAGRPLSGVAVTLLFEQAAAERRTAPPLPSPLLTPQPSSSPCSPTAPAVGCRSEGFEAVGELGVLHGSIPYPSPGVQALTTSPGGTSADRFDTTNGVRSDEVGRFNWTGLHAGRVTLQAQASGWLPETSAPIELIEDRVVEVALTLRRAVELQGRVFDERRQPLPGALVERGESRTRTSQAGLFALPAAAAEESPLRVRHGDFAPWVGRVVPGREPVVVTLSPGAGLRGRVLASRGQELPSVVRVEWVVAGERYPLRVSGGQFEGWGLPSGEGRLVVLVDGREAVERSMLAPEGRYPREITADDLRVELPLASEASRGR